MPSIVRWGDEFGYKRNGQGKDNDVDGTLYLKEKVMLWSSGFRFYLCFEHRRRKFAIKKRGAIRLSLEENWIVLLKAVPDCIYGKALFRFNSDQRNEQWASEGRGKEIIIPERIPYKQLARP